MNLSFEALFVICSNELDWEIQQVVFDTVCDNEDGAEDRRKTPYVSISRNFEFPGPASVEWHDGNDDISGASIISANLEANRILIDIGRGQTIAITFALNERRFRELAKYVRNILSDD